MTSIHAYIGDSIRKMWHKGFTVKQIAKWTNKSCYMVRYHLKGLI